MSLQLTHQPWVGEHSLTANLLVVSGKKSGCGVCRERLVLTMCQVKLTFKQIEHPGILMIILNGCFAQIHSCKLHNCDIDLIASHFNAQLPCNASWKPDPGASFTDAFTISWAAYYFYAFPPFSIILHCLQKAEQEEAEGIPVVPNWLTKRHGTPNLCR